MSRGRVLVPPAVAREREAQAWALVQEGKTQAEIAGELKVSQPAVSQILKRVALRVRTQLDHAVREETARQASCLDHIYNQAMGAWSKSKLPRQKTRKTKLSTISAGPRDGVPALPTGIREEETKEASTTEGNFLFLETALHALGDKRKLLGLDAPKKIDHTLTDKRRPLEKMSPDELREEVRRGQLLLASEQKALGAGTSH